MLDPIKLSYETMEILLAPCEHSKSKGCEACVTERVKLIPEVKEIAKDHGGVKDIKVTDIRSNDDR